MEGNGPDALMGGKHVHSVNGRKIACIRLDWNGEDKHVRCASEALSVIVFIR